MIGAIFATPNGLNGAVIFMIDSTSGASNTAKEVCRPIMIYRWINVTSLGYLNSFQSLE